MHIVILGDPINGFTYIGPFDTRADADAYIEKDGSDETAWAVMLTAADDVVD